MACGNHNSDWTHFLFVTNKGKPLQIAQKAKDWKSRGTKNHVSSCMKPMAEWENMDAACMKTTLLVGGGGGVIGLDLDQHTLSIVTNHVHLIMSMVIDTSNNTPCSYWVWVVPTITRIHSKGAFVGWCWKSSWIRKTKSHTTGLESCSSHHLSTSRPVSGKKDRCSVEAKGGPMIKIGLVVVLIYPFIWVA